MSRHIAALTRRLVRGGKTAYDLLGEIRDQAGCVTLADIDALAAETGLPPQHLRAVAEFYDDLAPTESPPPRVRVCNGEACRAAGADALARDLGERLEGGVGHVTCLGYCSRGPNLDLDGRPVAADGPEASDAVVAAITQDRPFKGPEPENPIHVPTGDQPCVLLGRMKGGRATAYPAEGYVGLERAWAMNREKVIAEITASGLRGRGGAGFPTGRKLETVAHAPSPDDLRYVIANLDEGDAGAFIDKELAERDPHALIEGLLIAAYACRADAAYIYVRSEYPLAWEVLQGAVAEAADHGYGRCPIHLVRGRGAYICGEETSLIASIEGGPAQARLRPPYPAQQGLWGVPTAVNNVETLCNLPWILEHGGDAYRALGVEGSSGVKLVSLNARVRRPGLYEVEMGVTLRELIFNRAGGMAEGRRFQAVLVGGPLGAFLPEAALDTPLAFESMDEAGAVLGHGGMVVFSDEDDLLDIAQGLMAFAARESCGKCFPCRVGCSRGAELLARIRDDGLTAEREALLRDLCEVLRDGSLCGLGGMAPAPVESLLRHFPELWEARRG